MRKVHWTVGVSVLCAVFTAVGDIIDETVGLSPSVKSNALEFVYHAFHNRSPRVPLLMRNVKPLPNDSEGEIGFWGPDPFDLIMGNPVSKTNLWFTIWIDRDSGYTWIDYIWIDNDAMPDQKEIHLKGIALGCGVKHHEDDKLYGIMIFPNPKGDLTIPARIGGKPVTSIGHGTFYECKELTSVTIPEGVTNIGFDAFCGCTNLTQVKIPDSVKYIEPYAFRDCPESLFDTKTIPGVKLVDGWVVGFADEVPPCLDLKGARGIADRALCSNWREYKVERITIPASVKCIGYEAFSYCRDLTNVNIEVGVKEIRGDTFAGCVRLESITIPDGILKIPWGMFQSCERLRKVVLPDSVTRIDADAFLGCKRLKEISIPDRVTRIGDSAFVGCNSLTRITIPDHVTEIGLGAFDDCRRLKEIVISEKNPAYKFVFGLLVSKDGKTLVSCPEENAMDVLRTIIDKLKDDPTATCKEIAKDCGFPVPFTRKQFDRLEKVGIIRRVTDEEGEHWEVVGNYVETPVGRYDYNF